MRTFENNQATKSAIPASRRACGPGSAKESADTYRGVIAKLNTCWRVIVCRDGIQWILQRRDGQRRGEARWTGWRYFRTRHAVLRACRAYAGEIDPIALAVIDRLPDWIGGGHG